MAAIIAATIVAVAAGYGVDDKEASSSDGLVPPAQLEPQSPGVLAVYPSSPVVPENLLKFHIHFATAMTRGSALEHVHLADGDGRRIPGALLDPVRELWGPGMRHLTVLLDPARVKTGLEAHDQLGRALSAGREYRLVVTAGWPTLDGGELKAGLEHRFRVGPTDRDSPAMAAWTIAEPEAGSREPLSVTFPEPYDQACLATFIRVVDSDGRTVPGDIRLAQGERQWRFIPRAPWSSRRYELTVDPRLEDLAGNNLSEVFDHPIAPASGRDTGNAGAPSRRPKPALAFAPKSARSFE